MRGPASAVWFRWLFRYIEAGLNVGSGLFGLVAPARFVPAILPSFAGSPLLGEPGVLILGRQLAMLFVLVGLLLFFTLREPSPRAVRTTMACFLPIDAIAIAVFVHGATITGWDGTTAFNVGFGAFLLLNRLPYVARPERAIG